MQQKLLGDVTLRFLAAPTDVGSLGGKVISGKVLEWIDKAAYACAVGWSSTYCVTAYVGSINFVSTIQPGHLVEVRAKLVYTGHTSMHIRVSVASADPMVGTYVTTTDCMVIFVAVDADARPTGVPPWIPESVEDLARHDDAVHRIGIRSRIEAAMREQVYTSESEATTVTFRFLAAPADVNWGGKTHGGTVMRWIDETALACASSWSGLEPITNYSGGVRFYRPIPIGHIVEIEARLVHTEPDAMHISTHVRSGDPKDHERQLTTHCLTIASVTGHAGVAPTVRQWIPTTKEDIALDAHGHRLSQIRLDSMYLAPLM